MVADYVKKIRPASHIPQLHVIFNGVDAYQSSVETEVLADKIYGPLTLKNRIRQTKVLTARPDFTGFGIDRPVSYSKTIRDVMQSVADELAKRLAARLKKKYI
jgi:hypothetical protein